MPCEAKPRPCKPPLTSSTESTSSGTTLQPASSSIQQGTLTMLPSSPMHALYASSSNSSTLQGCHIRVWLGRIRVWLGRIRVWLGRIRVWLGRIRLRLRQLYCSCHANKLLWQVV